MNFTTIALNNAYAFSKALLDSLDTIVPQEYQTVAKTMTVAAFGLTSLALIMSKCSQKKYSTRQIQFFDSTDRNSITKRGKEICQDGSVYEGDFVNGVWHGYGTLTKKKGSLVIEIYTGFFVEGLYEGKGRRYVKQENGDEVLLEGDFFKGEAHGKVKNISRFSFYEGDYVFGAPSGKGRCITSEGEIVEGDYFNGNPIGRIICTDIEEKKFERRSFHNTTWKSKEELTVKKL